LRDEAPEACEPAMSKLKLSIAIPYKQRLDNLKLALEALANQTMDKSEFEVVVGAMEYCADYVTACRDFSDQLDIVTVMSARPFYIPAARNLAARQARGEICVQMDADTLLPPGALQNLYDRHFSFGQNACVVGQVVGYNNNDSDVGSVEIAPYGNYVGALDELVRSSTPQDPRFKVDHVIPWAFAWTGLIALPLAAIRKHDLYFDEDFRGWGVDDLEWGYRICASGIPILLRADVCALHLPHPRDAEANRVTERRNYRRFLRKWPGRDVELAHAFGDVAANSLFLEFRRELDGLTGFAKAHGLGSVRGRMDGVDTLLVGVALDADHKPIDAELLAGLDDHSAFEVLPLSGLGLPYEDNSVAECRILPLIRRFSQKYRDAVAIEAARVCGKVITAAWDAP
jgi:glycosyltransferase involved in cell wall biosynthesis